jgi:hypothetical protein
LSRPVHFEVRRRRQRGVAMVEATIVAPVFILLLVSVLYVRDQALTQHDVDMKARSCAWQFSAANCDAVPPGCEGIVAQSTKQNPASQAVTDALQGGKDQSVKHADRTGVVSKIIDSLIDPVLDAAFGRSLDATVERDLERPDAFGGKTKTMTGRYHLACNLTPEDPTDVAKEAWKLFKP